MTNFDDFVLPQALLRGVAKAGFQTPTAVQEQVIPAALAGRDLMVSAATGTGKTAAFLLPMIERILQEQRPRDGLRALILVPTRELARQIQDHFMRLASYTRLTLEVIIGGESKAVQVARLRKNPDILVATPGRLLEFLELGEAELKDLDVLVLDEADRMLDLGFGQDVLAIIGHTNPDRQSMLFSATLHQRGLRQITERLMKDPLVLTIDPVRSHPPQILHQLVLSDDPTHKREQLTWLLRHDSCEKTLVFTNTRIAASALGEQLIAAGLRVAVLHGELDQRERNRVIALLQSGRVNTLIATDVAARGLDIPGVQCVINLDVPRCGDDYLHRTGRTGRAGAAGVAISLVIPTEWNHFQSIERYLDLSFERRHIEGLKARFKARRSGTRSKKKTKETSAAALASAANAARQKDRHRDRKNIGKRRQPSGARGVESGHAPLRKRGPADTDPVTSERRDHEE